MRKRDRGAATAYHEAGHAVTAVCLRVGLNYVTTLENEISNGHVMLDTEWQRATGEAIAACQGDPWHPSRLEAEKWVILQAGEVAQYCHDSKSARAYRFRSDRDKCFEILGRYAPGRQKHEVDAHYRLLLAWTVHLLSQQWRSVEEVAKALLERGHLTGDQVRGVINGVSQEQTERFATALMQVVDRIRKSARG